MLRIASLYNLAVFTVQAKQYFLCFNNSRIKGKGLASKINLSPPVASAAVLL